MIAEDKDLECLVTTNYYGEKVIAPSYAKERADRVLEEWDDICNAIGLPHCLAFGTCLGFYRGGGYIVGDSDIDVCIPLYWDSDRYKEFIAEMVKHGYRVGKDFNSRKSFYKGYIGLDVWTLSVLEGHKNFFRTYDTIMYNGRKYNIPHPVESYLELCYGDWRTVTPIRE